MRTRFLILYDLVDTFVSGTHRTAVGTALHGNFTPCGSHRSPPLPATAHGPMGPLQRSDCGWTSFSSQYAGHRLQARHGLFVHGRLLSLYLLPCGGVMACSFPHGFPFGRVSDGFGGPIQFPDCRQPAQTHLAWCACADWRLCRNVAQVETRFRE